MFTLSRSVRNCFLLVALATLVGCTEEGPPLAPEAKASFAVSSGQGGTKGRASRVEEFISWDERAWVPSTHKLLGHGFFERTNVSLSPGGGKLLLTLPHDTTSGAEIRSASRVAFRDVEIIMQTPNVSELEPGVPQLGTISAFFLYQLVSTRNDRNDEIDIEIINGTRKILFSTYVQGNPNPANQEETELPFNPSDGLHSYRIE